MRPPTRRYALAATALAVGLVAAGCGGSGGKDVTESQDVLLQPVAAQGPDPFTASTAKSTSALPSNATKSPSSTDSPSSPSAQAMRSVSGAEPGLYGGTHSISSCDVGRQVRFLTADPAKGRAFARASGIEQSAVAGYLRGLTPVLLRADSRVTNHGYRDGSATSFQSVLQAGTAVLVDGHGAPRVRCACGNPLLPPKIAGGTVAHQGRPWSGYQPGQVVVIRPVTQVITSLVIVNVVNNTWIERETGDDGDRDRTPDVTPSPTDPDYDPGATSPAPNTSSADPDDPDTGTDPATESESDESRSASESESESESADESSTDPGTGTDSSPGTDTDTSTSTSTSSTSPPCPSPTPLAPGRPATALPSVVPPGCPTPTTPPAATSSDPAVDQP